MTLRVKKYAFEGKTIKLLVQNCTKKISDIEFLYKCLVDKSYRAFPSISIWSFVYRKYANYLLEKVTHSIKCRLIIRQILNCYVGVFSTFFAVMRCLLLFFLGCWQGPLLAPSSKKWELHFFSSWQTCFIPVSYLFHTKETQIYLYTFHIKHVIHTQSNKCKPCF